MQFEQQHIQKIIYMLGIIFILFTFKPTLFFKPNGKPRLYGFGTDHEGYKKTLYTIHFCIIILAILISLFVDTL